MSRSIQGRAAHVLSVAGFCLAAGVAFGQAPPPPPPQVPAPPAVAAPGGASNEELLKELQKLKEQVKSLQEAKDEAARTKESESALKAQVEGLQKDLGALKKQMEAKNVEAPPPAPPAMAPPPTPWEDPGFYELDLPPGLNVPNATGIGLGGGSAGPRAARSMFPYQTGGKGNDHFPLGAAYKWNSGGGYTAFATPDAEFTLNVQNELAADGAFFDRQNTGGALLNGFNIPIQRLYLYGNVTKFWEYQVSEQTFVGSMNLLDAFVNVHYDDRIMFKMGKHLSPFLQEYYGWSPLWEPVIFNSPLFQLAGKRQVGATLWGKLLDYKVQYQAGIYNSANGFFFGLNKNKDFAATLSVTPFKGEGIAWLDSLGFGVGVEAGSQNYNLGAGNSPQQQFGQTPNGTGEPTTNASYVTTNGVPFFEYNGDVRAAGMRTRVAPQFFWFGRFSVNGEWLYQNRRLADGNNAANSIQTGYYINASYFLTGERYSGDGTGGYTMISPIRPFDPRRGGWGAWQPVFQISELNVGSSDINHGFASSAWATRLDQLMVGINWYPNKYARVSFDWVYDRFNKPVAPGGSGNPISDYNVFWTRLALFF